MLKVWNMVLVILTFVGGRLYALVPVGMRGWLAALGRNLSLGHGFVDAGGAGTVFLLAGAFALAAVAVDRISGGYSTNMAADWAQVGAYLQQTYQAIAAITNTSSTPEKRYAAPLSAVAKGCMIRSSVSQRPSRRSPPVSMTMLVAAPGSSARFQASPVSIS